jgi:hypothetical protein
MGRTIPTLNQSNDATIRDLSVVRNGLTTDDKELWDEFMRTSHLNERAISLAVLYDPFDAMVLAMLFAQFKAIRRLGGAASEWRETTLDSGAD